ncbi:L,D-transpeptidase family protein [Morganella psychrotolerans]|nr:murein L,D-transpeptidase family protein [Morganella psychrotolerans]
MSGLLFFVGQSSVSRAETTSLWLTPQVSDVRNNPVFIQIFKEEKELELYHRESNGRFRLVKRYPVCQFSGGLGPKQLTGDLKSPEGFYRVTPAQLNPNSRFYRAINLGFPNEFDRAHGYSGDYLMIHGDCKSVGCYAMTDAYMGEIYRNVENALQGGQTDLNIAIYPFRMNQENMNRHRNSSHMAFWQQLQPAYQYFADNRIPAVVSVINGRYVVNARSAAPSASVAEALLTRSLE